MMSKLAAFVILLGVPCFSAVVQAASKEDESEPDTTILASDIIDYIEAERPLLRGKHLVDVVERFKPFDSVLNKRFKNSVNVLNLKKISLTDKNLDSVNFRLANMVGTDLTDSKATNCSFVGVDFRGAYLRDVDFSDSNLSRADFTNADIDGAKFYGANLFKANFAKAKGVSREEIENLQEIAKKYRSLKRQPLVGEYDDE